jgi:hypothetical protein
MAELPRMLDPALRRRTGAFRTLDVLGPDKTAAPAPADDPKRDPQ